MTIAFIEVNGKTGKMWVNVNNIECFYSVGPDTNIKLIDCEVVVMNTTEEIQEAIREVIS